MVKSSILINKYYKKTTITQKTDFFLQHYDSTKLEMTQMSINGKEKNCGTSLL